jgi:hypothetical protein
MHQGQVFDDQASGVHVAGFTVFITYPVIADVGIGEGHHLLVVTGVGQNFLITRHGSVENNLSDGLALVTDGLPCEDCAVCKRQDSERVISLKRQKHSDLRDSVTPLTKEIHSLWMLYKGNGFFSSEGRAVDVEVTHYIPRLFRKLG